MRRTLLKLIDIPSPDEYHRNILMAALNDRINGVITQRELLKTCLEWSYHYCLDMYRPVFYPLKPSVVVMFDGLNLTQRDGLNAEVYKKCLKERGDWIEDCHGVRMVNQSNYLWLERMKLYFEWKGDAEKAGIVKNKMGVFYGQ